MMPINELLGEGLQLMLLGMGVVFVFLGLLVGVVTLISRIIQKIEARIEQPADAAMSPEDELLEVLTTVVQRYRSDHPR
jgi:oxaloacetate decarboxylase gamma subunit